MKKIYSIIGKNIDDDDSDDHDVGKNKKKKIIKTNENIFICLANAITKDLNLQFHDFDEIIFKGFIPKYLMHILKIDSIENVKDIDIESTDIQIKNIEAVVNFFKKQNTNFDNLSFDFSTPSKRS